MIKGSNDVKRLFCVIASAAMLCLMLCSCGKAEKPEITGGEIAVSGGEYTVSFTVLNKTGGNVSEFTLGVKAFGNGGRQSDEGEASYPIEIKNGASATVVYKTKNECTSATAVWYSYKTDGGSEVKGEFDGDFTAYLKSETDNSIATREQLAEDIIRNVRDTFLKKGTYSTGSYDSANKHLIIVSRYTDDYDTCAQAYAKNPDAWKELSDGVVSMSESCLETFRNENFDDVNVTVGVMSDDEQIMFSATNGELKESLGSQ